MNPDVDFSQLPLRDIHLPEAVGWWPPAPGWWLLMLSAVAAAAYFGFRYYQYRRQRAALKAMAGILAALCDGEEPVRCLQTLSAVLRRFVMTIATAGDARTVPGLTGERWLAYLDTRWSNDGFRSGVGRVLIAAPYAPASTVSREQATALTQLCADWVRAQRPGV